MAFKELPPPNYDYDVERLVYYYEKALKELQQKLLTLDLDDLKRAHVVATMSSIDDILRQLDVDASAIIEEIIPKAAKDGAARTLVSLGLASTLTEAQNIVKFNRLNKALVETAVADTQADLLNVTQNISRRVKVTVRQVTAEALRTNLTQGNNGTASLSRNIRRRLYQALGSSADTAIVDAAGRRWKLKSYTDMLVSTKMMEAHKEATINEAVSHDALYGVISSHGAKDACRNWEGRIVKLTPDAPGDYIYYGDIPRTELWHPRCRHLLTPTHRPDRLPSHLRELNGI